jgi:hypothetical protein
MVRGQKYQYERHRPQSKKYFRGFHAIGVGDF